MLTNGNLIIRTLNLLSNFAECCWDVLLLLGATLESLLFDVYPHVAKLADRLHCLFAILVTISRECISYTVAELTSFCNNNNNNNL